MNVHQQCLEDAFRDLRRDPGSRRPSPASPSGILDAIVWPAFFPFR